MCCDNWNIRLPVFYVLLLLFASASVHSEIDLNFNNSDVQYISSLAEDSQIIFFGDFDHGRILPENLFFRFLEDFVQLQYEKRNIHLAFEISQDLESFISDDTNEWDQNTLFTDYNRLKLSRLGYTLGKIDQIKDIGNQHGIEIIPHFIDDSFPLFDFESMTPIEIIDAVTVHYQNREIMLTENLSSILEAHPDDLVFVFIGNAHVKYEPWSLDHSMRSFLEAGGYDTTLRYFTNLYKTRNLEVPSLYFNTLESGYSSIVIDHLFFPPVDREDWENRNRGNILSIDPKPEILGSNRKEFEFLIEYFILSMRISVRLPDFFSVMGNKIDFSDAYISDFLQYQQIRYANELNYEFYQKFYRNYFEYAHSQEDVSVIQQFESFYEVFVDRLVEYFLFTSSNLTYFDAMDTYLFEPIQKIAYLGTREFVDRGFSGFESVESLRNYLYELYEHALIKQLVYLTWTGTDAEKEQANEYLQNATGESFTRFHEWMDYILIQELSEFYP
ncbi:hypothetical protein [Salinispira pacifica]|uniref:Uncharacterized protein n=1 Tax=Salinispira pacifica TaxID=1307761 RepID=V5WEW8_9SPIO|nr:hypothetical protein [Salinispira pacifica]AHC14079.1 hypothetical protein L21SP2_0650 [Salinispira pacifica]